MPFSNEKFDLLQLPTPLHRMNFECKNILYIKRDDLTDFALGGNKARKMEFFLAEALDRNCDTMVTYGSSQSNHCRIVSAAAARVDMTCILVIENFHSQVARSGNTIFYDLAGARIVPASVDEVGNTINRTLETLRQSGHNPYFIPGGGHSPLGTHAYVNAYQELLAQPRNQKQDWDYIFLASGTGTTQAGLIIGNCLMNSQTEIIGISVARNAIRGAQVIRECINDYQSEFHLSKLLNDCKILFLDDYVSGGYGLSTPGIIELIKDVFRSDAIVLDPTYTGKAFFGMIEYLKANNINNKNILFWHTGGLPCFFSYYDSSVH